MIDNIEIDKISTELEGQRFTTQKSEEQLLSSISSNGILEPVFVTQMNCEKKHILIDGFKRIRAAKILKINLIKIQIIGESIEMGVANFLILAQGHRLNFFEESTLINELIIRGGRTITEISRLISKSTSWVSMRVSVIDYLTSDILHEIRLGKFPPSSLQAILPSFKRLKNSKIELNDFVKITSGKLLSHREILSLANLWCKNGEKIKNEIKAGKFRLLLNTISDKCIDENKDKIKFLKNISIANNYLNKILEDVSRPHYKIHLNDHQRIMIVSLLKTIKCIQDAFEIHMKEEG